MSGEIKGETAAYPDAIDWAAERAPRGPRFLVLGSRVSGAYGVASDIKQWLVANGFGDARVDAVRDVARIDSALHNIRRPDAARGLPGSKPGGYLRSLGQMLLRREAVSIPEEVGENLPLGVIVFPQMRQYTPNGNGMPIPNPRSYIETLCDAWGVPVIFTEDFSAPEGVEATMARFQIEAGQ